MVKIFAHFYVRFICNSNDVQKANARLHFYSQQLSYPTTAKSSFLSSNKATEGKASFYINRENAAI